MKRSFVLANAATIVLAIAASAQAQPLVALSTTNQLLSYNAMAVTVPPVPVAITGLTGGELVLGIDFRPANGLLYGITTSSRLYTINTTTGAATFIATLSTALNLSGTNPATAFDFNPVADRLRIIANRSGQNLRIDPATGATIVDTTIPAYPAGDAFAGTIPQISAVGYTPNIGGVTSLFGYDDTTDRIIRITSPNAGTTITVAGLGGVNGSHLAGMDVADDATEGYLSLDLGGGVFRLFLIDLTITNPNTNSATLFGTFNTGGLALTDIAIVPIPEPGTLLLCGLAAAGFAKYRRRKVRC